MKFLLSLSVAAGALLGASSAFAAPTLQTISVSPSAAGLSASGPDFSFNGIRTSDFSTINLTSTGGGNFSFTEHGFLPIASFDPGNFTPTGLNASGGYGLYLAFTGSGTISTTPGGDLKGSFSALNYTLMGDAGFNSSFNHFTADHQVFCSGCGGDTTLANGTLLAGGTNTVSIVNPSSTTPLPSAFVDLVFNGTDTSFFVSPTPPFTVALDTQFSNTVFVTQQFTTGNPPGVTSVVTIGTTGNQGGSGSGQFIAAAVPEPASMMLLGSGLVGIGLFRRRSRR